MLREMAPALARNVKFMASLQNRHKKSQLSLRLFFLMICIPECYVTGLL